MGTLAFSTFLSIVACGILSLNIGLAHAKKTIGDAGASLDTAIDKTGLAKGNLPDYLGTITQALFGTLGIIFFVLTTYAGITWFLARGEDDKIETARNTLIASVIGLFISIAAYAIASFVAGAIGFGTQ